MTANAPAVRAACTAAKWQWAERHKCKHECEHVGGKWSDDRNQCVSLAEREPGLILRWQRLF